MSDAAPVPTSRIVSVQIGGRELRPCVTCGTLIEAGAAYVVGPDGPDHARHRPDPSEPPAGAVDLYAQPPGETFPGGPLTSAPPTMIPIAVPSTR
jgi:hypothetical protein